MVAILPPIELDALYSPEETWTMLEISKACLYLYDRRGEITHEIWLPNGRRKYRGREIIRFHGNTNARSSSRIKYDPRVAVRISEGTKKERLPTPKAR